MKVLVVALLFTYCSACIENKWMETLSCYGPNITSYPNITDPEFITHMDIINTSLMSLPEVDKFPNLRSMDIRDNSKLYCIDVLEFKQNNIYKSITTDCDDQSYKNVCKDYVGILLQRCF
jgi:hypothetical protein